MRWALVVALVSLLAACSGQQHMLDAKGVQAGRIVSLFLFVAGTTAVVYLVVLAFFAAAMRRGLRRAREGQPPDESQRTTRTQARAVGGAIVLSVVLLFVYLVVDIRTGRAISSLGAEPLDPPLLSVKITGHQWWWEIEYEDSIPSRRLTTANELHLPVGRVVLIKGTSADVIHSFWVPNLHGKRDLVPGYMNTAFLRADTTGVWWGQCGEFCGHQHAKMRLVVVAEPPDAWARWYESQLRPAPPPADSSAARGHDVFMRGSCVMCHAIRGTPAGSNVGPDLTHLASRRTIASGVLPNTRGHLAGWIADPRRIKPGTLMPPNDLPPRDLNALLDYLRSLR